MTETSLPDETQLPPCPECASEYAYEMGALLVCPMCGHEWAANGQPDEQPADGAQVIRDAVGNPLADGDTVTLVKTVKVSGGGGGTIKIGTKVAGMVDWKMGAQEAAPIIAELTQRLDAGDISPADFIAEARKTKAKIPEKGTDAELIAAIRPQAVWKPRQIITTSDNYIVDGHHGWASDVAIDYGDLLPATFGGGMTRTNALRSKTLAVKEGQKLSVWVAPNQDTSGTDDTIVTLDVFAAFTS